MASNTFDNPLHLALGDSAAGCVRAALAISPSISQAVMTIPDDLSHGPIDDGLVRAEYMRACYRACDEEWEYDSIDAFAPWQELMSDLFFSARLQALIAAGEIEAYGPQSSIRYYSIRRAA